VLASAAALVVLGVAGAVALNGVDSTVETARLALEDFKALVSSLGPTGYALYVAAYASLELVLLPATPFALSASALFGGVVKGTLVSSLGGLSGATGAFLIARYAARDRVLAATANQPKFAAIDRAIARDGFRVVLLVNLSPLSSLQNLLNYAYGCALRAYCFPARLSLALMTSLQHDIDSPTCVHGCLVARMPAPHLCDRGGWQHRKQPA
jgi:uncharacterized membrane protein YdjX (TVP38/TMEM64 family)